MVQDEYSQGPFPILICSDAASCLEERLAELHLSAPHDSEGQAAQSWSSDSGSEEMLSGAFDTYPRGLVGESRPAGAGLHSSLNRLSSFQSHSDSSLRPKPKSCKSALSRLLEFLLKTSSYQFKILLSVIRPVLNQKTVKKTDPVAK